MRHSIRQSPLPHTTTPFSRRLRPDLRQAVADQALVLAFQARRGLADHIVTGAEAQLRWPSRHHGVVQASVFLPIAAECGLTRAIMAWTLHAACRAAADWPEGVVSVPIPARLAQDGTLLTLVADALTQTGLPPSRLEIALPDPGPDDATETLLALSALRDLGLGVALDGFGRDGACLMTLKHLPLTAVKLDRAMLRDVPDDRAAAAMIETAIDYAHALDITVVAAAVETEAQRHFLRQAGCDAALEWPGTAKADTRLRRHTPSPPELGNRHAAPS
jgi:EAL domain-containing protein (putative c-di-GMP-specific phosphodiesterase class I)